MRINIRLSEKKAEHQSVKKIIEALPAGQRNEFLIQAILKWQENEKWLEKMEEVLRKVLMESHIQSSRQGIPTEQEIPKNAMNFLDSLMGDD